MVQQTITESKAKSGIANNNGGVGQSGASSSSQMLVPIKPGNINEMVPQLAQQWSQNALTNLREFVISYSKPYSSQLPASTAANLNQLLQQLQAAVPPDQLQPLTAILQGEVIPTKVFDEWYEQFIRKIKMNPTWGLKLNN
ncbi:hypothetical protein H4219_003584 [Mycoemilia scoparia]|uniref:Hikeshi-like C-terminal domain-containing protein n=1 Tax=Mycoemilia scoparia TaxID=417184 RepID=A0A9W8DSF2_9FUNG|nr:hypothetical protein H4219_003584 [Mycoemilia scoparia]